MDFQYLKQKSFQEVLSNTILGFQPSPWQKQTNKTAFATEPFILFKYINSICFRNYITESASSKERKLI